MRTFLCLFTLLLSTELSAQLRNYGSKEGLTTGEVTQVIELPAGGLLVNTVGDFKLFNGDTFVSLPCRLDSLHRLDTFGRYGHVWQGDSLLWLRDFYYLYLFDVRQLRFRYDVEARLRDEAVVRLLNGKTCDEPSADNAAWQDTLRKHGVAGDCPINTVCRDRQQGVWMGTRGHNLFYLPPSRHQAVTVGFPGQKAAQAVACIGDNQLLAGTEDGLWLLDAANGHTQLLKKETNALYHSATTDRQGRVWICSQQGIDCLEKGRLKHYDAHNIKGFVHDHVYFVRPMQDGQLLTNNDHHVLGTLEPENGRFTPFNKALPALQNYRVIVDALPLRDGRRILGITQNGAFLLDIQTQSVTPLNSLPEELSDKFNSVWQDKKGRIWLGTQNGLAMMSEDTKTSRLLLRECVRGMTGDAEGFLWFRGSEGLTRIDTKLADTELNEETLNRFRLTEADGIPCVGLQERSVVMTPKGLLCLANACGVTLLDTRPFRTPASPPLNVLTGVKTAQRAFLPHQNKWELDYGESRLELSFSAFNYAAPDHTHYRYRLKGLSDQWTYTQQGAALFTTLPFGHYLFEAQASILDGKWGPLLQKEIIVHRPFWLSAWAIVLYVLLTLLALSALALWYRRRTRALLEKQNDERVNRLFLLRQEARHRFAQSVNVTAKDITANSREEELMNRMMQSIERNLGNSEFTVDMLANDVCVSRASLYRIIKNILGITPNDFIRNIRLKQAAQMLEETDLSVSQISECVGFGTPRYFTQQFKKLYGVTPSEYQNGKTAP